MAPARSQHPAARRWCARAAVVFGGVVAGSAAAWLLSTTGAAADSADDPVREAAERVQEVRDAAGKKVQDTVDRVGDSLRSNVQPRPDESEPKPKPLPQDRDADRADDPTGGHADDALAKLDELSALLGDLLSGDYQPPQPPAAEPPPCAPEFQDFCERVADWFQPGPGDLVPALPGDQGPDAGHDLPTTLPAGAHVDTVQPESIVDTAGHAVEAAVDVASSGVSQRGDPQHKSGLPGTGSPLGLTAPGSGSIAAGHADGSPMAITAASAASAAKDALAASTGALGAPRIPGAQPGVTPD